MNHSMLSCDRATHLKIVVIALVAAVIVAVAGINAHVSEPGVLVSDTKVMGPVVKAGKPSIYSSREVSVAR
jgi:hypothetical protein